MKIKDLQNAASIERKIKRLKDQRAKVLGTTHTGLTLHNTGNVRDTFSVDTGQAEPLFDGSVVIKLARQMVVDVINDEITHCRGVLMQMGVEFNEEDDITPPKTQDELWGIARKLCKAMENPTHLAIQRNGEVFAFSKCPRLDQLTGHWFSPVGSKCLLGSITDWDGDPVDVAAWDWDADESSVYKVLGHL